MSARAAEICLLSFTSQRPEKVYWEGCSHLQTTLPVEAHMGSTLLRHRLAPALHTHWLVNGLYLRLCLLSLAKILRTEIHPAYQAVKLLEGVQPGHAIKHISIVGFLL